MSRTLKLNTSAFSTRIFQPVKLSGSERINELFTYQVVVKTPDSSGLDFFKTYGIDNTSSVDLTRWIGQNINVGIEIDFNGILGSDTRWISGQITSARYLYQQRKSHFYSIEIRPFLSFANLRSDYKIFQDKNVVEILDEILTLYSGTVDKQLDESRYPKRVYQTQFGETDFTFFERLCSEWGINFFFIHNSTGHTLVLSDEAHNHQAMPNLAYRSIDYYPPDNFVTDKQEVISDISLITSAVSGAFSSRDYDYQQPSATIADEVDNIQPYPESAKVDSDDKKDKVSEIALKEHQIYEYSVDVTQAQQTTKSSAEGSKTPSNGQSNPYGEEHTLRDTWNLERIQQSHFTAMATGHIKGLSCGHTFKLNKHPNSLANIDWNVVGTELLILDMREESHRKASGLSSLLSVGAGESNVSKGFLDQITEEINSSLSEKLDELKNQGLDSLDRLLTGDDQTWQIRCKADLIPANIAVRPKKIEKPRGTLQNALVVGEDSVHTDELGRIKVQFYWDRYGNRDDHSSCWVRVNEPWAGAQMGAVFTPRVGQEVLIDYINNDPDLPVCIGKVNNSNNEPNWKLTENKELSGFRSREFPSGNSSSGRSNHLVFDDTAGKIQTQLKSDHAHSQLSLGDITRIEDNAGKKDARGQGFELRTDDWGSTRAAKGLYLSTYARNSAESTTMDATEAKQLLEEAKQLVKMLSKLAVQHEAEALSSTDPLEEAAKTVMPEEAALGNSSEGSSNSNDSPTGFTENLIVGAGEAGIALVTPQQTHQYSGSGHSITTPKDLNTTVGDNWLASIGNKLSFFVQEGIKIFSGKGKVEIHAHDNAMDIIADKTLKVISANDLIEIAADKEVLLTSGGAYIRIKGGHIDIHAPGIIEQKASAHPFLGPTSMEVQYELPKGDELKGLFVLSSHPYGKGVLYTEEPYKLYKGDSLMQEGLTDEKARIIYDYEPNTKYRVELTSGHNFDLEPVVSFGSRDEILSESLTGMGFRHVDYEESDVPSHGSPVTQILSAYRKTDKSE